MIKVIGISWWFMVPAMDYCSTVRGAMNRDAMGSFIERLIHHLLNPHKLFIQGTLRPGLVPLL